MSRKVLLYLDSLLFLLFILTLSPRLTGLTLHEIIGFIFIIPVVLHLLIEWHWVQNSLKLLFRKKSLRLRINFLLNTLLLVSVTIQIVSGLVISQVVVPFFNVQTINDGTWRFVHNQTSTLTMLLVAFHIALNWRWIVSAIRTRISSRIRVDFGWTPLKILYRILIIASISFVITVLLYQFLGKPSTDRLYTGDEFARFRPTIDHGAIQLFGETFLIVLFAYIGRRWLKIKL